MHTATTKLVSTPLQVHERQKNDVLAAMFCLEIAHRLKVWIMVALRTPQCPGMSPVTRINSSHVESIP